LKLRKLVAVICCFSLVVGMLVGCGGSSDNQVADSSASSEDNTSSEDDTSSEVEVSEGSALNGTITIWEHNYNSEEPLKEVIAGFNELHPDVNVEYEIKEGDTYHSLLATAVQSGEVPDIFWTNGTSTSRMADMANNDVLMDLTDVVDFSELEQASLSLGEIDGAMYSVPWMCFDTRAAYYNKDIFEKEGWEKPTTFSEFEELLEKQKDAGYIPLSFSPIDTWAILFMYEPLMAAMAPEYTAGLADYSVKATDQPAIDVLEKMLDWFHKGYYGENALGVSYDAQTLAFATGKTVMTIAGSWENTTIIDNNPEMNLGAFQIPAENGQRGMIGTFANGFSVYKHTENVEAAQAFIQYCATLEAQQAWVQATGAPSGSSKIKALTEIANEISDSDTTYTSWQSVLANYAKEGESATTIWEEDSPKVFSEEVTIEQMMNDIAAVMQ